jgi:hypothetical protein
VLTALTVKDQAAAAAAPVELCVRVMPLQSSAKLGQAAHWEVGAWAEGANVPGVTVWLQNSPAGGATPGFTSGCGAGGTNGCYLGAVIAGAAQRIFTAEVTVPATAAVSSVTLTVTASAAGLTATPRAAEPISFTTASAPSAASTTPARATPASTATTAPLGGMPGVTPPVPSSSPSGDASGLFPNVSPSQAGFTVTEPTTAAAGNTGRAHDTSSAAPPTAGDAFGAEVVGLIALALAFILAGVRMTFRRRPVPQPAGPAPAALPAGPTLPAGPAPAALPAAAAAPAEQPPAEPQQQG